MKNTRILVWLLVISFLGTACGRKNEDNAVGDPQEATAAPSNSTNPGNPNPTPIDDDPADDSALRPPFTFDIDMPANKIWGVRLTTDKKLKVRFTPNLNCQTIHVYGNLGVSLHVNGQTRVITPTFVNTPSPILDLSDRVGGPDGKTTLRVIKPVYDFYCRTWRVACPFQEIYISSRRTEWERVRWCGRLEVATDQTLDLQ